MDLGKTEATGHLNAKKAPMKAHENILVFYKKQPIYNPQKTIGHTRKQAVTDRESKQGSNYGKQSGTTSYDSTERFPRSVVRFSTDKQKDASHPTQKPVALFEYLIKTYTNEGDLVLDNCAGSGTTAIACENLNRRWICVEKDIDYYNVAVERIKEHVKNR